MPPYTPPPAGLEFYIGGHRVIFSATPDGSAVEYVFLKQEEKKPKKKYKVDLGNGEEENPF